MPASPQLRRLFAGWDRPVLTVAVDWLCQGWTHGPLELHDLLVMVPTAQSARRLREALAARAAQAGTGVLAPTVVTPELFLTWGPKAAATASALESLAVWTRLLLDTDLAGLPDLFPPTATPPRPDLAWALGAARRLSELRSLLGERGLTIADAAARLRAAFPDSEQWEPARWHDLESLEQQSFARLAAFGLHDANCVRREAAAGATLPAAIRRVLMVAVPDPLPLAIDRLQRLAESLPVTVLIHAPAERAADFDEWGRPAPVWQESTCLIDLPEASIHLVARPQDQARLAVETVVRDATRGGGIGVVDADVMPHLELLLREAGVPAYDPAGTVLASTALFELLGLLAELALEDRFETAARLLRHPDMLAHLRARGLSAGPAALLAALDELQNRHLPHAFSAAARWAYAAAAAGSGDSSAVASACQALADLVAPLRQPTAKAGVLLNLLQTLYAARTLDPQAPADRRFAAAAAAIADTLTALDSPVLQSACPAAADRLRLALGVLATQRIYPDSPAGMELDGWLELHWNDAPTLVITGCNEGRVPESVVGHAFLPDTARRALGLLHNDRRLARDAYLLSALVQSRQHSGGVTLVLGKVSGDGDVLRPSRLLLRCPDTQLPARALRLFEEIEPEAGNLPWHRAWALRPPQRPPPTRLAVTAFRDYLACPFRFYLRRVLRMQALDDRKSELDALDFGTLCHAALEAMAREPGIRDSDDPRRLAAFLVDRAAATVEERFGTDLPAAVVVQYEAACQRLRAAARVQAEQRALGWRIIGCEVRLGEGAGIPFHGLSVGGTVDRIDRHADGRLRVLDYKTREKATAPAQEHLGSVPRAEPGAADPLAAGCEVAGKPKRWVDLQLPLYLILLQEPFGPIATCGYFALPKAVTETAVLTWDDLTPDLLASARNCAAACAEAIAAGRFWPPAEKVTYDDFERLFHGSAAESIAPDCVPFLEGRR
jgi:ATP-dependent helicase/nuclease subunit B